MAFQSLVADEILPTIRRTGSYSIAKPQPVADMVFEGGAVADNIQSLFGGGKLSFEHQSQIARWVKLHGVAWVKVAMREASDANVNRFGVNFKLLITEWNVGQLYQIINARYNAELPVIITSNLDFDGLKKTFGNSTGDRIISRLSEICTLAFLGTNDRRLSKC